MGKKKRLTIWLLEDDKEQWKFATKVIKSRFPRCIVKCFLNAGYAARATGSPDFILLDIGGAMGFGTNIVSLNRHNVEGLAEEHPGAIFILYSAIGHWAEELFEELSEELQAITKVHPGFDKHPICDIIERLI